MKRISFIAAAALALIGASPALAECPDGQFTYYTSDEGDPPAAVENCVKTADHGKELAVTGSPSHHLTPVMVDHDDDPETPEIQLVIDDKPIVSGDVSQWKAHQHDPAKVKGINGVAVGNGALVGERVTFTNDNGTPDDPEDDFEDSKWVFVNNGTALGADSHVKHDNSTAIGAGATSTADHQVTLGTQEETISAPGITSQKSKDRQSGPIEVVTSDGAGNLATDGGEIFSRLGSLEDASSGNAAAINANTALLSEHAARLDKQSKGLAIAMAMPDTWLSDKERFAIAASFGGFDGETAIGAAIVGRIDETWSVNGKIGADTDFEEIGFSVGARAGF